MKIDELANKYYKQLTENEHKILQYILENQNECREITCESLANKCHVSRTTLLRFCRKLGLNAFAELKYLLKSSDNTESTVFSINIEQAFETYHKIIDEIKNHEYQKICSLIYEADIIYIYGTGNEQKAEAEEFKRIFLSGGKCVIDLFDLGEVKLAQMAFKQKDLFIIISLSGETPTGIDILKSIEDTKIKTLSITRWNNNTIARICKNNLYVGTEILQGYQNFNYEMTAAFYVLFDILFVNYLDYKRGLEIENR